MTAPSTTRSAGRRRPSGEPPPLPRHVTQGTRAFLVGGLVVAVLWVGFTSRPVTRAVTDADLALLDLLSRLRTAWLTDSMRAVDALGSVWVTRAVAWVTLGVLLVLRRFQHLFTFLVVALVSTTLGAFVAIELGRMRPAGIEILDGWEGHSHPSLPIAGLGVALVGVLYTLVPAGRRRNRAAAIAACPLAALVLARLYLAVDHPTDAAAGLVIGVLLPVTAFRLLTPDEAMPVTYRRGRRAHLDVTGARGEAIRVALADQLGVHIASIEPFGLRGSAGSTPLRLDLVEPVEGERCLFGKLYAVNHLRSDRWYKLVRTVRYGRLEDERPFNTVRRLVEYEDHLLRLARDAGLPTPEPRGFVEITPEREYLIVTEFVDGAVQLDHGTVDDDVIDQALMIVRRMWDSGLAHRDIKPSNLLLRGGRLVLVDLAFGAARPSPWRQAVDLSNMMLTLALRTGPERVYERALLLFSPDDVAEAFAASRSVTIPAELRAALRDDDRDLLQRFRALAPDRRPVAIQRWTMRRLALTLALVAGAAVALALLLVNLRLARLL